MPAVYCRHIQTSGRRCASPALRGKAWCYYHARSRACHASATTQAAAALPDESLGPVVLHPMRDDERGQIEPYATSLRQPAAVAAPLCLEFPQMEDRESIQIAASMILAALGRNQLDPKRAATMLYGLQVAVAVLPRYSELTESDLIEVDTTIDADGNEMSVD